MEPEHHHVKQSPLTIPLAIVVAGGLVAAAIFLRGDANLVKPSGASQPTAPLSPPDLEAMALRPIDETRDHIRGNPNAAILVVEFSDTECPFCKRFHETMRQIINEYGKSGKVAWAYRHFPIVGLHSKAPKEAEALECAAELGGSGKFWEYSDRLFTVTPSNDGLDAAELPRIAADVGLDAGAFSQCLSSGRHGPRVQADYEDGVAVGVGGTPYSVLVLRKSVSLGNKRALLALMEPYRDQRGELPISFSVDRLRIALNGALPLQALKSTIDILLK
jgi:protein-disulfide isomerase